MKKNARFSRFVRDQRGANLVEYIMLVGLVAILAIGGFKLLGNNLSTKIKGQADAVDTITATQGAAGAQNP